MVKIKFTAQGSNSLIGGFSHGTVARVNETLGKHLVEEIKVAVYVDDEPVKPADSGAAKSASKNPRAKPTSK